MAPTGWRSAALVLALIVPLAQCAGDGQEPVGSAGDIEHSPPSAVDRPPFPVDRPADYQIGGDYRPPDGVEVVVRDWFLGRPLEDGYSICYINAFQTQPDDDEVDRPDERSRWPSDLVLSEFGDDPSWPGEYVIDISTSESRQAAADWVEPMIRSCAQDGFDAVELDNLDSWTRFDDLPFGSDDAAAYATMLSTLAHDRGMASAQKNTLELDAATVDRIGFDFLVVERCGELDECAVAAELHDARVLAVEYQASGFAAACDAIGDQSSVVLRDDDVTAPGSDTYVYAEC